MELADTVVMFCTETFVDAFNSAVTFKGKLNPFAEVSNSGMASQRRILETPISETIPAERIVKSPAAETFIVADKNIDFWYGTAIRYKYPILPVGTMGAVGSIGETLASTQPDKAVYGYPYFVRREVDEFEASDYWSGYEISFSRTKEFDRGTIFHLGSRYYRLKTDTWIDGAGFSVAQAVLVESPMQSLSAIVKSGTYNPTTDTYTTAAPVSVTCFVEPLRQDYEFVTPSFEAIRVGDKAVSILKAAATMHVGDQIGPYKILSVRDFGTWATYQCRAISG